MKRLLIMGIVLAFVLSAGTAMAGSDTFQTLGSVSVEQTVDSQLTGTELNAVEGKSRKGHNVWVPRYKGHKGYIRIDLDLSNKSSVRQSNSCNFCGNGNGGFNGGLANSGVIQDNANTTLQSIF